MLRDPARRAGYDVQRRAALTRADAPATGVAVPVRAERRIPLWDAQDHGSAHASPLSALRPFGLEMFSARRLALPRAALVPTLVVIGRPGVGPTR